MNGISIQAGFFLFFLPNFQTGSPQRAKRPPITPAHIQLVLARRSTCQLLQLTLTGNDSNYHDLDVVFISESLFVIRQM